MKTAVLVDGAFFLKRLRFFYGKDPSFKINDANVIVNLLEKLCYYHMNECNNDTKPQEKTYEKKHELYRIFFYDCPPLMKKAHYPISKKTIDFSKTPQAILRLQIHEALKRKPKTAIRLGRLSDVGDWGIKSDVLKEILNGKKTITSLSDFSDNDFYYDVKQKSIDMKIGIDITSLAYKKLVERIVLIAGDSDFVPAAKLARREGIMFILDPMWSTISPDLFEHIDGLISTIKRPKLKTVTQN